MASIQVETGKTKNMRGRITGYFACIGDVRETGTSPAEALVKLQERIEKIAKFRTPRTRTIAGYALVMCPDFDATGYHVMLVFPDGHVSEHTTNETDERKIENSARLHVAQLLYPSESARDVLKGTGMEGEFASWVRFQESYKQARAEGKSDLEAHRVACGY